MSQYIEYLGFVIFWPRWDDWGQVKYNSIMRNGPCVVQRILVEFGYLSLHLYSRKTPHPVCVTIASFEGQFFHV